MPNAPKKELSPLKLLTRGKKRGRSKRKSRGKRRRRKRSRKRRKSRRKSRRRKNLKKQVGGEKEFREMMDKIRGNEHIIKLKDKGFKKRPRPTNCRGATHVLISELIQLVDAKYIGWGDWAGHSVAIVKAGGEIQEHIRIDLAAQPPPDDIGNYYVFDGSFHQILKFEDVKSSENILFTGRLIDYYNDHYIKSGRTDTILSILPVAKQESKWMVWDKSEYGLILD